MPKLVKKKALKKKSRARGSRNFPAIQQGVGRTVRKPFGERKSKSYAGGLCATCPVHLPLPVATGPYTVVRVTQLITSSMPLIAFGTFKSFRSIDGTTDFEEHGWAPYCACSSGSDLDTTPAAATRFFYMGGLDDLGDMATITPAALTVQIMNPNPLQTTTGILYIGRMATQLRGENENTTFRSLANQFVSYQAPRLCSAGKLALRGVTVDAAPFNMTELMDFDRIVDPDPETSKTNGYVTLPWKGESSSGASKVTKRFNMKGFSPIVVHNPNSVSMQYLVTMELRVRFDIGHPAASTHTHHQPVGHNVWAEHINQLVKAGHGVMDIAERVAQFGGNVASIMARLE